MKERYEFSIDGRQMASLSVVGLILIGVVFALGVVVGKRLSGAAPDSTLAARDPLKAIDERSKALDAVRKDPELTFQDNLTQRLPSIAAPDFPVASAGKADAGVPHAVAKAAAPAAPASLSASDAGTKVQVAAVPDPKPAEILTNRIAAAAGAAAASAPEKVVPPAADVAADGAWTLQLAAYQDRSEAERYTARLRGKGYAPFLVEATVPSRGTWYRVRMGRFASREAASRYLSDFQRETQLSAFVTAMAP